MKPSDRVVLYSDGLTDAQNQSQEFFGTRRLKDVIFANRRQTYGQLHQNILDAVEEFTGGREQTDDVTLLVLEYQPD